jgi:hypothetical protein
MDLAPIRQQAATLATNSAEVGTRNLARLILDLVAELEKPQVERDGQSNNSPLSPPPAISETRETLETIGSGGWDRTNDLETDRNL